MVSVVLGMFVCVGLALGVVALVAVPARRQGRDVLTERGEEVVGSIRDRQFRPGHHDRAAEGSEAAEGSGAAEHGSLDSVAPHRG